MKPKKLQKPTQGLTPVANATGTLENNTQKAFRFCILGGRLEPNDPKPEVLFEIIREHLGDVVAKRIESLPGTGLRLLVGGGKGELAKDVVSYLCYFHNTKSVRFVDDLADRGITCQIPNTNTFVPLFQPFYTLDIFPIEYINCGVKTENVLMDNLNALIPAEGKAPRYLSLFLNNLNPEYRRIFEWLAEMTRNQATFYPTMLIVTVKKADNLPEEFSKQFEIINLEPAQNTANDVIHFPLSPEDKVSDIKMNFLDNKMESVRITTPSQSQLFHFAQMGFLDKKKGTANRLWDQLTIYVGGNGITNQKDSERINDTLQAFFKTKQKLLNKRETFFKISKQTTSEKKTTSQGKARECPSCQDWHNHFCKICKEESEHCQECHDSLKHVDLAK